MRPRRHPRRPRHLLGRTPVPAAIASLVLLVGITPAAADEVSPSQPPSEPSSSATAEPTTGPEEGTTPADTEPTGQPTDEPSGGPTDEAVDEQPDPELTQGPEPEDESEPTGSSEPGPSSPESEGAPSAEPSQEPTEEKTPKEPRSAAPAPERADAAAAAAEAPTALRLEPGQSQVTAGEEVTFTVWADGAAGAPVDVTAESVFEFVGGRGHCDAGVCRSERAGIFVVKVSHAGLTALAHMEVHPGDPVALSLSPGSATVIRNQPQSFHPSLRDEFGNPVSSAWPEVDYEVPDGVDCTGRGQLTCRSTVIGTHHITATLRTDPTQQATATLVVEPGRGVVSDLTLTLGDLTPTAGDSVEATVTGLDSDGAAMDVTDEARFWVATSDGNATHDISGECTAGTCTFEAAGNFMVAVQYRGQTTAEMVVVAPAAAERLVFSPSEGQVQVNQPFFFRVRALDRFGNEVLVGDEEVEVTIDAPGICGPTGCMASAPGTYVVRAAAVGLTASAEFVAHPAGDADPGQVARIAVSQMEPPARAGDPGRFVVHGFDADGRPLGTVTDHSTLAIEGAGSWTTPAGSQTLSCTADTCMSTVAGEHTVTATFGELTATTSMVVTAARLTGEEGIGLAPGNAVVTVGEQVRFSVGSVDRYGNPAGSGSVPFPVLMVPSAGATCEGQTCWSDTPGTYVIGIDMNEYFGLEGAELEADMTWTYRAVLTVLPAPLDHIEVTPDAARVAAGEQITLTATAYDADDNVIGDVTADTTFAADGAMSCTANVCRSTVAGVYTIEGGHEGLTDTTEVTVSAAAPDRDALTPVESLLRVGESVDYVITRFDEFDNVIGTVTGDYSFTAGAGATCVVARCESRVIGEHTVTATAPGQPDLSARFTVELPDSAYLVITPDAVTVAAGVDGSFSAALHDSAGAQIADVTAETTFEASEGATCAAAACSSTAVGDYVVTGSYDGLDDDAALRVLAAGVDRIAVSPEGATIDAGATQAFSVAGFDEFDNPVGDLTDDAAFAISEPGSCAAHACGADQDGDFTVTVSYLVPVTGPTGPTGPPLLRLAPQAAAPGDTLTATVALTVRALDTDPGDDPVAPEDEEDGPEDENDPRGDDGDERDGDGGRDGDNAAADDANPAAGLLPAAGATFTWWHAGTGLLLLLVGVIFLRRRVGA